MIYKNDCQSDEWWNEKQPEDQASLRTEDRFEQKQQKATVPMKAKKKKSKKHKKNKKSRPMSLISKQQREATRKYDVPFTIESILNNQMSNVNNVFEINYISKNLKIFKNQHVLFEFRLILYCNILCLQYNDVSGQWRGMAGDSVMDNSVPSP